MSEPPASDGTPQATASPPGRGSEEAFLEALLTPSRDVCGAVLLTLLHLCGARFAILIAKEGQMRRRLFARRADGTTIGRPDKVLRAEHVQKVHSSPKGVWVPLASDDGSPWAGLRIHARGDTTGALLVCGLDGSAGGRPVLEPDAGKRLSLLLGLAIELGKARLEARGSEGATAFPESCLTFATSGFSVAHQTVLEHRLSGSPEIGSAKALFHTFPEIVGRSPAMAGLLHAISMAARSDMPVLIEGESGTGKELIAKAIHKASERCSRPFLGENCGALPENLAEAEIFGYEMGAFTGASRRKAGIFERAQGGTVFLDEVGEMDLSLQKKLLRVLQEKEIRRVGGEDLVRVDFRLVSATNRALDEMVSAGKFREDLYYRLNVATVTSPPLRDRKEDIPLLVHHFNEALASEVGRPPLELSDDALAALQAYHWPGNVRELRNEMWSLASSVESRVEPFHLSKRILRSRAEEQARIWKAPNPLQALEKETIGALIREAIRVSKGNHAEAARKLGISRSSLYRRLRRYRLG